MAEGQAGKHNTEQRILDAAARVFLEKGMDGARMAEIAAEAGINKALLHYYFRSKKRLYGEVFEREIRGFFNDLFSLVAGSADPVSGPDRFIMDFIGNYIDLLARNPQVVRFLTWELGSGAHLAPGIIRDIIHGGQESSVYSKYRGIIEKAVRSGRIREVDPDHLLISMLGMCVYTFLAAPVLAHVITSVDFGNRAFLEKRKAEIFSLLWNGIKPERGGDDL
jgi:TetR/AcrR family transcriptional regulator